MSKEMTPEQNFVADLKMIFYRYRLEIDKVAGRLVLGARLAMDAQIHARDIAKYGPEKRVDQEVVNMLKDMTDGVLERAGVDEPTSVVIFSAKLPGFEERGYDLTIFSIADDTRGFNTGTAGYYDNSRRWVVYSDRGTNFGAAYDNKGAIYEHGLHETSGLWEQVPTPVEDLIREFQSAEITFELRDDLGQVA